MTSTIKNFILITIPTVLINLNPVSVGVLGAFILIDIITGVGSTLRIKGKRGISSRSFGFGILFKLLMILVPVILVWTGAAIDLDLHFIATWALNLLVISEALSILGNIQEIKTGEEIHEMDALTIILKKVRLFLEGFLDRSEK